MVRRAGDHENASDKGRVRIILVELEGNNASLQEGIRTLTAALRPPTAAASDRRIAPPAPPAQRVAAQPEVQPSAEMGAADEEAADGVVAEGDTALTSGGSTRSKRSDGPPRDRNAGLAIDKSLGLRPEGKDSLRDFYERKSPPTLQSRLAVFVYYLKNTLEIEKVSVGQVFTCFKEVGVRVPSDLPQALRNVANHKGWVDSADRDDLQITSRGQEFVEHDLPKVAAKQA